MLNSKKTLLVNGLSYELLLPQVANIDLGANQTFHDLSYQLILIQRLDAHWSLVVGLFPGLAGDFSRLTPDDLLLRGSALASYSVNEDISIGLGVGLVTLLGRQQFLPVLQLDIDPRGPLYVQAALPGDFDVGARLGPVRTGARARLRGTVYNRAATDPPEDVLRASVGVATAFVAVDLPGPFRLDLEAGTTFLRRFELESARDTVGRLAFASGPVLSLSLLLVPPTLDTREQP